MQILLVLVSLVQSATIFFKANYDVVQDGTLFAGNNVTINYDMERAKCPKFESQGSSLWSVRLDYKMNGVQQPPIRVEDPRSNRVTVIPRLEKGDLVMWFTCFSPGGITYDSKFGENFYFQVLDVDSQPRIVFRKDYTNELKGELVAGGSVVIEYAEERARSKNSRMFYSMNGKEPQEAFVLLNRNSIQPVIDKLEKGTLDIWFRCSSVRDTTYDPITFGEKYTFAVQ